jgi:hypothetical protein
LGDESVAVPTGGEMSARELKGAARYKTRAGYENAKAKAKSAAEKPQALGGKKPAKPKQKARDRVPEKVGVRNIKRGKRRAGDSQSVNRGHRKNFKGKKPHPEKYGKPEKTTLLPEGKILIDSTLTGG